MGQIKYQKRYFQKNYMKQRKTNPSVVWPSATLFTIKDLHHLNSKFVEITLRVRLAKAITGGKVAEIGAIPGDAGRPRKVFSMTPVTQATLNKARAEKINLVDNADVLFNVVSISPSQTPTSAPFVPHSIPMEVC